MHRHPRKHAVRRVQIRVAEHFGRLVTARPARCKISLRPRTIARIIAAAFVPLHADRPYHLTTQSNQPVARKAHCAATPELSLCAPSL